VQYCFSCSLFVLGQLLLQMLRFVAETPAALGGNLLSNSASPLLVYCRKCQAVGGTDNGIVLQEVVVDGLHNLGRVMPVVMCGSGDHQGGYAEGRVTNDGIVAEYAVFHLPGHLRVSVLELGGRQPSQKHIPEKAVRGLALPNQQRHGAVAGRRRSRRFRQ